MDFCGAGKEITDARIKQYEALCKYLISIHFAFVPFPTPLTADDVLNQCRYEVVQALKRFDPVKALGSTIADPKRRAAKLEQKAANPERALAQAEKNVVYSQIDFFLRRLKWNNGYETGPKKRRAKVISIQKLGAKDSQVVPIADVSGSLVDDALWATIKPAKRQQLDFLYNRVLSASRANPVRARRIFDSIPETTRELLAEYIQRRAEIAMGKNPFMNPVRLASADDDQSFV